MRRTMRCALAAALVALCAPAMLAAGHSHAPTPSVWTLNLKETDFGTGPQMRSDVIQLLTDTDKWLKYADITVDDKGKTWKTSWSGPQDGTLKPVSGMAGAKASFKTEDDSSHMVLADGSVSDSHLSISDDKKKVSFKVTGKTKDGKGFNQTLVYDRTK